MRLVCLSRVMYGMYKGGHYYKGISGYAFSADLGDSEKDEENKCYCPANNRCYKSGVLDSFKCQGKTRNKN